MQTSISTIVEFSHVYFSYDRENYVLRDVNLKITRDEYACIVGPNGGGKSTFLLLILGLLTPDRGKISVFGSSPIETREKIGYMPQSMSFDRKFPVTVLEVVLMGRLNRHIFGWYSRNDKKAALEALEKLGMAEYAKKAFFALSGGQRQRVLLARALTCDPKLLLLDEPTSNVDPITEQQFFEILHELNKEIPILMVSHDLGFVSQKFKRVICVNKTIHIHPTSEITGEMIQDIYGSQEIRMVRHDHCCIHKKGEKND